MLRAQRRLHGVVKGRAFSWLTRAFFKKRDGFGGREFEEVAHNSALAMTPTRTPTSRPRRNLLSEMPAEMIALCLDELDAPDLGRLCLVSRAFRDALSTPTTWTRQAAKSLCTEGTSRPAQCGRSLWALRCLTHPLARLAVLSRRIRPAARQHVASADRSSACPRPRCVEEGRRAVHAQKDR